MTVALEIAVASLAGARIARDHGATRVELCGALELGGLTPSAGLLDAVLDEVGGLDAEAGWQGVHVLVRPRPGGFVYDADERATYERELDAVLAAGVDGVVIGALTEQGAPDLTLVRRLAGRAHDAGAVVTFHRAIDQSPDPAAACRALTGVVDRVLTSGGAERAVEGIAVIDRLVALGGAVTAGGGVGVDDISALVAAGVTGVHLSAKQHVGASAAVPLGVHDGAGHWVTDVAVVTAAARALRSAGSYA